MHGPLNVKFLNSYCCFRGVWCLLHIGHYQLTQQNVPEDLVTMLNIILVLSSRWMVWYKNVL